MYYVAPQPDSLGSAFIIKSTSDVWMSLRALGITFSHHLSSVTRCWFNAILASKFIFPFFRNKTFSLSNS